MNFFLKSLLPTSLVGVVGSVVYFRPDSSLAKYLPSFFKTDASTPKTTKEEKAEETFTKICTRNYVFGKDAWTNKPEQLLKNPIRYSVHIVCRVPTNDTK